MFGIPTNKIDCLFSSASSADWYKGRLTDEELAALENPPTSPKPKVTVSSRRKPSRPSKHQPQYAELEA